MTWSEVIELFKDLDSRYILLPHTLRGSCSAREQGVLSREKVGARQEKNIYIYIYIRRQGFYMLKEQVLFFQQSLDLV